MMATLSLWPTLEDEAGLPVAQWMGRQHAVPLHDLRLDFSNPVVFSYYYRRFFPLLVRYARWLFHWEEMTAQDIVQECCLEFWQRYQEMGLARLHPRQFRRFLKVMVFHRGDSWRRQVKRLPSCSLEQVSGRRARKDDGWVVKHRVSVAQQAESMPALGELLQQCEGVIRDQSEQQGRLLQLVMQGYTLTQVAEELALNVRNVGVMVQRAQRRVVRALYQQGNRHAKVLAAMRRFWSIGMCRQCGVTAVLSSDDWCAVCLVQAGQGGQEGCQECGKLGKVEARGLCHACYLRYRRRHRGQMVCRECGQGGQVNSHSMCSRCVERVWQQPCSGCGQTNVRKEKGRCPRCRIAAGWQAHRMAQAAK